MITAQRIEVAFGMRITLGWSCMILCKRDAQINGTFFISLPPQKSGLTFISVKHTAQL